MYIHGGLGKQSCVDTFECPRTKKQKCPNNTIYGRLNAKQYCNSDYYLKYEKETDSCCELKYSCPCCILFDIETQTQHCVGDIASRRYLSGSESENVSKNNNDNTQNSDTGGADGANDAIISIIIFSASVLCCIIAFVILHRRYRIKREHRADKNNNKLNTRIISENDEDVTDVLYSSPNTSHNEKSEDIDRTVFNDLQRPYSMSFDGRTRSHSFRFNNEQ
eukprot:UN33758